MSSARSTLDKEVAQVCHKTKRLWRKSYVAKCGKDAPPLIQDVREAYSPFLLAKKGWERKNAELRERVGLLSNQFSTKGRQLVEALAKLFSS